MRLNQGAFRGSAWRMIMHQRASKTGLLVLLFLQFCMGRGDAYPLGTTITYQGRLTDGSTNANGNYSLRFVIYDAANSGNQIGPTLTITNVPISNGFFTVALDFGSGVFSGDSRWLALEVGTNGGTFTLLSPRQCINPAPYALYS